MSELEKQLKECERALLSLLHSNEYFDHNHPCEEQPMDRCAPCRGWDYLVKYRGVE